MNIFREYHFWRIKRLAKKLEYHQERVKAEVLRKLKSQLEKEEQ